MPRTPKGFLFLKDLIPYGVLYGGWWSWINRLHWWSQQKSLGLILQHLLFFLEQINHVSSTYFYYIYKQHKIIPFLPFYYREAVGQSIIFSLDYANALSLGLPAF